MRHVITASSLALVCSTGCLMDGGPEPVTAVEDRAGGALPDDMYRPVQSAVRGRIQGDVGPVAALDANASRLSSYDDGYYITVETVVELEERAVMTLLSVSNGAGLFVPGTSATFNLGEEAEGLRVTMLGCVGEAVGIYNEYDKPADEVDLDVTAPISGDEDEVDVAVEARWYDRDDTGEKLDTFHTAHTAFTLVR